MWQGGSERERRAELALVLRAWQLEVRQAREKRLADEQAAASKACEAAMSEVQALSRQNEEANRKASKDASEKEKWEKEVKRLKEEIAELRKELSAAKVETERSRTKSFKDEEALQKKFGEEVRRQNEVLEKLQE